MPLFQGCLRYCSRVLKRSFFVKPHSNLQTQLQLVGVGVDFVFPRKKKSPHLASSRRKDPTCMNFDDCLLGVWRVSSGCLEGVWKVPGGCLKGVGKVPAGCLKGVWRVYMGCPNGNLVISQGRSSQGQVKSGRVKSGQVNSGQV